MSDPVYRFQMNVNITITDTEAQKDIIKDAVLQKLQDAFDAGQIDQASWTMSQNTVPEGGVIK